MKTLLAAAALSLVTVQAQGFTQSERSTMPAQRFWWSEDANQNGEYNYSTTAMTNGSTIKVANQWGDVPTGFHMTGPYGDVRVPKIDLSFQHNGYGYAEANLTTSSANTGVEPSSEAERDAGKVVNGANASLLFSAPEAVDGIRVKLVDQYGHSSPSVDIKAFRSSYGRYAFSYAIPTSLFSGNDFDFDAVKSVTFFVDGRTPAGSYRLSILGISFITN